METKHDQELADCRATFDATVARMKGELSALRAEREELRRALQECYNLLCLWTYRNHPATGQARAALERCEKGGR